MSILILPTELLSNIISRALEPENRPKDIALMSQVCKRFYSIAIRILYSRANIRLYAYQDDPGKGGYWVRFLYAGESWERQTRSLQLAKSRLESYQQHGEVIRSLAIKTDGEPECIIYDGTDYLSTTRAPSTFINPLVTSFTALRNISLTDNSNRIDPILPAEFLRILIKFAELPSLCHLSLHLTIDTNSDARSKCKPHSINDIISQQKKDKPCNQSFASLNSLALNISVPRIEWPDPPAERGGCWLLSAMSRIFHPTSISTITHLNFSYREWGHSVAMREYDPKREKLRLPKLQRLKINATTETLQMFNRYFEFDSRKIRTVDADSIEPEMIVPLLRNFTDLRELRIRIKQLTDDQNRPESWAFVKELKDVLPELRTLTTYFKPARAEAVEEQMKMEFEELFEGKVKVVRYTSDWTKKEAVVVEF